MAGSMVYRQRVGDPAASHLATFRAAMAAAQARSDRFSYAHFAGLHGAPGWHCWHHQFSRRTPVQARLFLPWHRAYLYRLEQALQDRREGTALPWWDWSRERGVPAAYARTRVDGRPNPLFDSRIDLRDTNPPIQGRTRRRPGDARQLPTPRQVESLLRETDWPSFSDALEDVHDRIHGWVGGDMASVTTAAYDPIFFAHHCMIDRIWSLWQVLHGNGGVPDELLDLSLEPFGLTFRQVLDTQALGYEYAGSVTPVQ